MTELTAAREAVGEREAHEAAFARLLAECGGALRRIAQAYGAADGEADDLHQEILLQLWRGIPGFRGEAALSTWAYRVALNTGMTWRRRARTRLKPEPADDSLPSPSYDDGAREGAVLREFLASLNAVDRSVLILYMEGLPHRRIGDVVGLSENAVGVRIHRMRKSFEASYLGS